MTFGIIPSASIAGGAGAAIDAHPEFIEINSLASTALGGFLQFLILQRQLVFLELAERLRHVLAGELSSMSSYRGSETCNWMDWSGIGVST